MFNGHHLGLLLALVTGHTVAAVNRLLHDVSWLWELHKLHRSIEELDWLGNFRFHWGEIIVDKMLSYLPQVVLGIDSRVLLAIAVVWTLMLDLIHANLAVSWGPLRYVFNSPMMHVWHHDVVQHGTAYWPADRDRLERLG